MNQAFEHSITNMGLEPLTWYPTTLSPAASATSVIISRFLSFPPMLSIMVSTILFMATGGSDSRSSTMRTLALGLSADMASASWRRIPVAMASG